MLKRSQASNTVIQISIQSDIAGRFEKDFGCHHQCIVCMGNAEDKCQPLLLSKKYPRCFYDTTGEYHDILFVL
jgi:hypothetical protein